MPETRVTYINVIEVEPARTEELITLLREGFEAVFRAAPGFEGATVLASSDGTRVLNVARWQSREHVDAVRRDPRAADLARRTAALATQRPALYELVFEVAPA